MSRHQAVRNLDFQNELDEADGYEYSDEDELSPEDREQMTLATTEVKGALGPQASRVTTAQIEEAVWHYYYDVDKAVAYLVSKVVDPTPKAAKKSQTVKAAEVPSHDALREFFRDMPWGSIPEDRQTLFIAPPKLPGGLLGGGSDENKKMSKLAQIAAARKRKHDEKKAQDKTEQVRQKIGELSMVDPNASMAQRITVGKRIKTSEHSAGNSSSIETKQIYSHSPPIATAQRHGGNVGSTDQDELPLMNHSKPSTFAQALFGSPSHTVFQKANFPLPYMAHGPSFEAFSRPSPDDVVIAAQTQAGKKATSASIGSAAKKQPGAVDVLSTGAKDLKIEDTPPPRSKNIDVLSEYERSNSKKTASFVVVGHVDAGKSTMMGRLLLDLNVVDQRTVDKLRREAEKMGKSSFALAWVLDQRTEERQRGVTIDIATNRFETETTAFTILDAPGHRDFIPNMIAGASQADFAILVVDASTGAFESGLKGQTKEHSLLIRSMGVARIIVAVNKLDTVQWSQERFEEIKDQVTGFLTARTLSFQEKNIVFVPVSGLHGDNLVHKSKDPAASWYHGSTLVEELEKSEPSARALSKPLRMTISEVFRNSQHPLSISGRIDAGSLQAGDSLLVQPSGEKAYVKGLQLDDQPADWAVAGQNVVIHLANIDPIHIRVGDIVCDPVQPVECLDRFTLKAVAFSFLMPMQVDIHRGRLHAAGKIEELSALLDKVTGSSIKKRPKIAKPGNTVRLVVKMDTKVPLEAGQRVILRSGGETVAAGLLE